MWKRLLDSVIAGVVVAGIAWLLGRNVGTAVGAGVLAIVGGILHWAFRAYWRGVSAAEEEYRREGERLANRRD